MSENKDARAVKSKFWKLLKYDFRTLFKRVLPTYIIFLSIALILGLVGVIVVTDDVGSKKIIFDEFGRMEIFIRPTQKDLGEEFFVWLMIVLLFILNSYIISIIHIISIIRHYYSSFFSEEGPLTLTVPASVEEHLFTKNISAFIMILLTWIINFLALFLIELVSGNNLELIGLFEELGKEIPSGIMSSAWSLLIIGGLIGTIYDLQIFYTCFCCGQLFHCRKKEKKSWQLFGIYLLISQLFVGLFIFLIGKGDPIVWSWIIIALKAIVSVGLFFIQRNILKNKLYLQ